MASTAPAASKVARKVPATMSTNAAITMIVKSQEKIRNRRRPVWPMYFSMSWASDLPLFLMLA